MVPADTRPPSSADRPCLRIGVDLGSTYTVAAVQRHDGVHRLPIELLELGPGKTAAPTVLFVDHDSTLLFGQDAATAGAQDPARLIRGFRRRIGDPTPVIVAGTPWRPEQLAARMIRWSIDWLTPESAAQPRQVVVTHPVGWGAHTTGLLRAAADDEGFDIILLAEPLAAVAHRVATHQLAPGSTVAVFDLGGGSFDATVVRTGAGDADGGHQVLGTPESDAHLGGADFDEAVFEHVRASLPDLFETVDETDPADLAAVACVRAACTRAKEQLSSDTETSIHVALPGREGTVRLHRSEFENLIRPLVESSVEGFRRAIASAGLEPQEVTDLLLVGGSARIPLVAQVVSEQLDRPVVVDDDPRSVVARGAALTPAVPGPRSADPTPPPAPTEAEPAPERPAPPGRAWIAPLVEPVAIPAGPPVARLVAGGAALAVLAAMAILVCVLIAFPSPVVTFSQQTAESSAGTSPSPTVAGAAGPAPRDAAREAGRPAAVDAPRPAAAGLPSAAPAAPPAATAAPPVATTQPQAPVAPVTTQKPAPTTPPRKTTAAPPDTNPDPVPPKTDSAPPPPVQPPPVGTTPAPTQPPAQPPVQPPAAAPAPAQPPAQPTTP